MALNITIFGQPSQLCFFPLFSCFMLSLSCMLLLFHVVSFILFVAIVTFHDFSNKFCSNNLMVSNEYKIILVWCFEGRHRLFSSSNWYVIVLIIIIIVHVVAVVVAVSLVLKV